MSKIIECVPNFSEGRNSIIIDELAKTAQSICGVSLLDYSADKDHNRSVFTLIGSPTGIENGAFLLAKKAAELIDLTKHKGEHPYMGAVDVIPFIPLRNASMSECIEISKRVGERIYTELSIPVFLYERSTRDESRQNLAFIRKGGFGGMEEKIKSFPPDYGKDKIHPTAGVVAVGARQPLIAFNVNLSTSDISIANRIAKIIRESNGGFKSCKAIGIMLHDRNIAQVSMNMTDYEVTSLYTVFDAIKNEAERLGVHIIESELIGMTPAKALTDCGAHYLKLADYSYSRHVLESRYH